MDRPPPRAAVAALHPRTEFPRQQSDRSGDRGADAGGEPRRRRARSAHDPRQPLPREGAGRQGDHGPSVSAAAPEPDASSSTRTCCSASASTTSAAASSIARSRPSTKCCGSIRTTATRWSTCRSFTRSSISGRDAYDTRQRLVEADATRESEERVDSRVSRERDRPRGDAAERLRRSDRAVSRRRSISTRERCPRI